MTRAAVLKILEAELKKPDLSADLRLKYASEIAILRGWKVTQGRLIDSPKKASRGIRKMNMWQRWLRERCPAEYRPQSHLDKMPFGLEDCIVSYIKKACRYRWTMKNLDAALQYALQIKQRAQAEEKQQ